jgi:hypothetical protein
MFMSSCWVVVFCTSGHGADYFCKFKSETASAVCVAAGNPELVFQCPIAVTTDLLDYLLRINTQYPGARNPEGFRREVEQFRKQLEKPLRTEAEEVRKKSGSDPSLYREILSLYSQGISLYKDGIAEYQKSFSHFTR